MERVDFNSLIVGMRNKTVERPNKASSGTLSGHAAGEPFEKLVYHKLKDMYPKRILCSMNILMISFFVIRSI